jgi:hypothetical protein
VVTGVVVVVAGVVVVVAGVVVVTGVVVVVAGGVVVVVVVCVGPVFVEVTSVEVASPFPWSPHPVGRVVQGFRLLWPADGRSVAAANPQAAMSRVATTEPAESRRVGISRYIGRASSAGQPQIGGSAGQGSAFPLSA